MTFKLELFDLYDSHNRLLEYFQGYTYTIRHVKYPGFARSLQVLARSTGMHKFYVAVVNKMIKMFPFHDDALRYLAALNSDPVLRQS